MSSVEGVVEAAEANGTLSAIQARLRGSIWSVYLIQTGVFIVAAGAVLAAGLLLDAAAQRDVINMPLTAGLSFVVGAVAEFTIGRRLVLERFRRRMASSGLAVRYPLRLELSDSGVAYTSGVISKTAGWPAVTELFKAKAYWIFLVQTEPWIAPTRFFADPAAEKAFVRTALAHMSAEARERSPDAVKFAAD